jgi:hypothetical protein
VAFLQYCAGRRNIDGAAMSNHESGGGPVKPWPVLEGALVAMKEGKSDVAKLRRL